MKQLCIFLSLLIGTLMSFSNCATKRKTKDVEQVKVESEKSIVNDSSVNLQLQKSSYDYVQNYSKNESLIQKLGLSYAGTNADSKGSFTVRETKDGYSVDIEGMMQMALDQVKDKNENITKEELLKAFDSIYNVRLQQDLAQREQRLIDSFKSNSEKEKSDVSIWVYVLIGGVLSLIIFLAWLNHQINKLNKMGGK